MQSSPSGAVAEVVKEGRTTGVVVEDEAITMTVDSTLIEMMFQRAQIEAVGVNVVVREAEADVVPIKAKTQPRFFKSIGATSLI